MKKPKPRRTKARTPLETYCVQCCKPITPENKGGLLWKNGSLQRACTTCAPKPVAGYVEDDDDGTR